MGLFSRDDGHGDITFERVYRDRITGFEGKAIGVTRYVSGCDQIALAPGVDKDGKLMDVQWFDDDRLIDVEAERAVQRTSTKGGPNPTPPARLTPS